jgi:hypothetical protein
MSITSILALLALAVLLFIAAELYVIARELSRGLTLMLKEREAGEREGGGKTAGQIINVNLSPAQSEAMGQSDVQKPLTKTIEQTKTAVSPTEPVYETYISAPAPAVETRSVPSGQFALKCARCQAENSSYRHECFNCGASL